MRCRQRVADCFKLQIGGGSYLVPSDVLMHSSYDSAGGLLIRQILSFLSEPVPGGATVGCNLLRKKNELEVFSQELMLLPRLPTNIVSAQSKVVSSSPEALLTSCSNNKYPLLHLNMYFKRRLYPI